MATRRKIDLALVMACVPRDMREELACRAHAYFNANASRKCGAILSLTHEGVVSEQVTADGHKSKNQSSTRPLDRPPGRDNEKMVPTLVSTWRKIRSNEKGGLHAYRSHSEVVPSGGVRLHALSTTAERATRSRASSVEVTSSNSRGTTEELDEFACYAIDVVRSRSRRESHGQLPKLQLKVFVGSWNMAAKDPFATSNGSNATYMGDAAAAAKLEALLPAGYDLYVLGTQEKVTKHLHAAVLARLHAAPENLGRRYVTLRQAPKRERDRERRRTRSRRSRSRSRSADRNSESSSNASPSHSRSGSSQVERFRQGSFAVEASTSRHNDAAGSNQSDSTEPRESIKEVRGRGDGAFLSAKSTSIAVYCASDLEHLVAIDKVATHKFSWSSGSKGGVAVTLRVATGERDLGSAKQTLTFANCHLEANKPALRRQQLATLSTKLGQALCADAKDLASCSDHVVWMGDFNYRIHTLDGESVLKLIASGKHLDVHDRYDSMKDDLAMLPTMETFCEPTKWPTFLPTYKKIPDRPARLDASDPAWPTRVYRVLYKEPFYKGGKLKARVPGWCDRILYCSRGGARRLVSWLEVEQVDARDNYRAVNDGLCESDHSPVFCTFDWTVSTTHALTWG